MRDLFRTPNEPISDIEFLHGVRDIIRRSSLLLTTDEILTTLRDIDHPKYSEHKERIEAAVTAAALEVATALGVQADEATFNEATFSSFGPRNSGDFCPPVIGRYSGATNFQWPRMEDRK